MTNARKEYVSKECSEILTNDGEYGKLSERSVALFNELKAMLKDTNVLHEYEETLSAMQSIAEIEAFKLGILS